MAIRESLLDALSSIATSDFVRSVTAAGASSKVTVSNLAKTIVENYTGSTLAGSSQSVKSAIDALDTTVESIDDYISSWASDSSYCKLPDGTLICYGSFTSSEEWAHAVSFGQTFSSVPVLMGTIAVNSSTHHYFTALSATYTTGTFSFITTADAKTVTWIAIGRWK